MTPENHSLIEKSSFVELGQKLQKSKEYIKLAYDLEKQDRCRIILDRESKEPYLKRYYYLNYRPFARIVIHNILRSDLDGLHDHPWGFQTFVLSGGYYEHEPEGRFWRPSGYHGVKKATDFHRLELDPECPEETWTLFMMGPKEKEWGFLNEDHQWEQWQKYLERKKIQIQHEIELAAQA